MQKSVQCHEILKKKPMSCFARMQRKGRGVETMGEKMIGMEDKILTKDRDFLEEKKWSRGNDQR